MNGSGHHIIKETSDSLVQLLSNQFKESGYKRVHIIVAAPKPDAIEGKLPAVCLYLYQVALDEEGIEAHIRHEVVEVAQPDGSVKEFMRRAPMWVRLDYLISTWAQTPEDEQLLLGLAIKGVLENPVLERDRLKGDSFTPKFELPLTLSSRLDEGTLARFWGSLNQPVRPAIQAWTSVPIRVDKMEEFTRIYAPPEIRYRDLNTRGGKEESGPVHEVDMPPAAGMSPSGKRIMTKPKARPDR